MPQISRTTTGMQYPGAGAIQALIDSLRGSFVAGTDIQAAHINTLLATWRSFNDHMHTVPDLAGIADYGNTNPPGYSAAGTFSSTNKPTSNMGGFEPADVAVGDTILASKHEEIRVAFQSANDHVHSIDDVTS